MRKNSVGAAFLAAVAVSVLAGCATRVVRTSEDWQKLAQTDLEATHRFVIDAHPGAIDEQNPEFLKWAESGYREALKLVPRVNSYDGMLAVTRFYVGGFKDQHFSYSDNLRNDDTPMHVNGWRVEGNKVVYRVVAVAPSWPSALPPLGAQLLGCDGQSPATILQERVAPFLNWRSEHANGGFRGGELLHLYLKDTGLQTCEFQSSDGTVIQLPMSYQAISTQQYFTWFIAPAMRASRKYENAYEVKEGVLWVRAGNFSPNPDEMVALEALLAKLKTLKPFDAIVFDVRGNGGGNSAIGERIFEAATGGLEYDTSNLDQLPRTYAQWRVSSTALKALSERYDETVRVYGKGSSDANWARALVNDMRSALAAKQPWVEQVGGRRITRADVVARGGKLRQHSGKIVLLTDAKCFSACLDFADTVLKVPGALHVGETTSADAVYIDGWRMLLPSGNVLSFPLKVWRNRVRGNNEPLRPSVEIALDTLDDAAIHSATIAALRKVSR